MTGFLTAVASTAIFAAQNIYSKVLFQVFFISISDLIKESIERREKYHKENE
jgi:hypothetical protein